MTESLGQDGDARGLQSEATDWQSAHGGQEAPIQLAQASISVGQPAAGEEVVIQAAAGQRYVIDFNPDAARAAVQGNDLVLLFANGGRVVFQGLGDFAGDADAPVFEVAGQPISGGVIFAQTAAQSSAGGAPSLETAAAPESVQGTGETRYDDNTGNLIDLLNKQPGIPLTELLFRIPELEPSQVFEEEEPGTPTPGGLTPTVLAQSGSVDEDDLVSFSPPSQEQSARVSLAAILAFGQQAGSDTLDLGAPFDPAGTQPTFVLGEINVNFGTDVPGTIAFTPATIATLEALNLTSSTDDQPIKYALVLDNHLLIAFTGDIEEIGELVFLAGLTPSASTGAFEYGFELYGSINHPAGNGENVVNLPILFQVTDSTGDSATGSFGIKVVDDVPTIDFLSEVERSGSDLLCVSEANIVDEFGTSASTTATIVFGADGPESDLDIGRPVSLALTRAFAMAEGPQGPAVDPEIPYDLNGGGGTPLTSGGQAVQIEVDPFNPLQINGFINQGEGTARVFTATLQEPFPGPVNGAHQANFVFNLLRSLDHPDIGETMHEDKIRFEFAVTVLDDDGDTDVLQINVEVKDNEPTVENDKPMAGNTALVHDETPGIDNPNDVSLASFTVGLTAALAAVFAGPAPAALGAAKNSVAFDHGTDGPGSIALSGVVSGGLTDTATGQPILVVNGPNGTLVGHVGAADGPIAFVAFLEQTGPLSGPDNAGTADVWFVQYRAVQHDNPADHDEANPEAGGFADESLVLSYVVSDSDGETATGAIAISVEDDGPDAVDDPALYLRIWNNEFNAGGNVLLNDSFGADGPPPPNTLTSFTYIANDGAGNPIEVTLFFDPLNTTYTVRTFIPELGTGNELTVNADGTYVYSVSFAFQQALQNGGPFGAGFVDDFTYTITDGDGDTDSATQPIRLSIDQANTIISTDTGVTDIDGGANSDFLAGAGNDNVIRGFDGDDLLFGGDGDDELVGGLGDDLMFGDAGADRFVFDSSVDEGNDEIRDFSVLAGDTIEFSDVLDPADGIVDGSFSKTGDTVSVELQGGTVLTVIDIDNMINTVDDLFNQNPVV